MESTISKLLEKLSEIQGNDENGLINWCNEICLFYEENSRHSYSDITTYILQEARRIQLEQKIEEMDKSFKEIQAGIKKTEDNVKSVEALAKKTRHKLNNMQKEYITILGIFASIVIAFIGGAVFSTSVLQNIANASIYRISFISVGIAAVIINLIYILVRFIQELNKEEGKAIKYPTYMIALNIIILIGALLVFLAWLYQLQPIVTRR